MNPQVYVGVAKRKTLAALDLRPEYAQWLTTNEAEARIQVPPGDSYLERIPRSELEARVA